jgi:hypothetical protein
MSMETGFIEMGMSIFIILNILASAAPRIWEEIGIAGGGMMLISASQGGSANAFN